VLSLASGFFCERSALAFGNWSGWCGGAYWTTASAFYSGANTTSGGTGTCATVRVRHRLTTGVNPWRYGYDHHVQISEGGPNFIGADHGAFLPGPGGGVWQTHTT